MGRPKTGDRAALRAASAQVSRRTYLYAKKAYRSPFLRLAVDAGKIAVRHAAYLADYDGETQKWALEPAARKDVLERVKLLRIAEAEKAGLPSLALGRLQKAWSKANDDDRQAFLTWIAETRALWA
jgi:hypothetical protein